MNNTVGSQQDNIICGMLLGDSFLERNGKFVRLVTDHSLKQKEYLEWKARQINLLSTPIVLKKRSDTRTGKIYSHCVLRTYTNPALEKYVSLFYQGNRKIIPKQLSLIINPQMLAIWIMDDGYKRNDCNALRLNTQGYTLNEQKIIKEALKTIGLKANIQKHKEHFVIYIPSDSMQHLRNLVGKFIAPTMEYKIA